MQITTAMSDALGQYLDLTSRQMQLTASNMANVDTPGYKTQGFDFEQEFARQLNDSAGATGLAGVQVRRRMSMAWWRGRMGTMCRWIARDCNWRSRSCSSSLGVRTFEA